MKDINKLRIKGRHTMKLSCAGYSKIARTGFVLLALPALAEAWICARSLFPYCAGVSILTGLQLKHCYFH